jgi:glycerol-3-phosphate acyltransferase PlsY
MNLPVILTIITAYVAGATPFGFLVAKSQGVDIRKHGSGNIGATNVLRTLGKRLGMFVLLLDVLKGCLPVLLGKMFLEGRVPADMFSVVTVLIGFATIFGHNYTFWLGFKGGKGIATSAGALLAIMPITLLIGLAVWFSLFYSTRYVAVASIGSACTIPVAVAIVTLVRDGAVNMPFFMLGLLIAFFGVWRHRSNIKKLRAGTEHRFTRKTDK